MKTLSIELKKCKRSSVIPIMLVIAVFGALYALVNFAFRKESLLSLPLPPMDILLTQLYGVIITLNLFGVVVAACLIYSIENTGGAMKKMYTLPVKVTGIYNGKIIIMTVLLALCYVIQYGILAVIGKMYLPENTFELGTLICYGLYSFITSLPALAFMLFVSSRSSNMWITLGIGVIGFFSGMATAFMGSALFLLNPFMLMLRPAVASGAVIENNVLIISIIETAVFVISGLICTKFLRYE